MPDSTGHAGLPAAAIVGMALLYPTVSLFSGYLGTSPWQSEWFDRENWQFLVLGLTVFFALPTAIGAGICLPALTHGMMRQFGRSALIPVVIANILALAVISTWSYRAARQLSF